jgi:hypothetical protein
MRMFGAATTSLRRAFYRRRLRMKLRACAAGAALLVLCSPSMAAAREEVRPSQSTGITKSRLHVSRAAPKLQHANQDGATVPIVIAAVTAAGVVTYVATKEDKSASR